MALEWQTPQYPFRFGLDEGTDPRQVPPGTLVQAENVEWVRTGELRKRDGIAALASTGLSTIQRLFTRRNELSAVGDSIVETYSSQAAWVASLNGGALSDVALEWQSAIDLSDGLTISDSAAASDGKVLHAWVTGDPTQGAAAADLYYQVINRSDGAVLTPPTYLDTGVCAIRTLASGSTHILLWSDGTNIKSLISGTTTTLRSDAGSTGMFDACMIGAYFVIAYTRATGIDLYMYSVASTPVQQASGTVTGEGTACRCVSIDGDEADYIHIGYATNTPAFRYSVADAGTLSQALAPVNVDAAASQINQAVGVKRNSSTTCLYTFSSESGSAGDPYTDGVYYSCVANVSGTVTVGQRATHYAKLISRPFLLGSTYYAVVANPINVTGVAGVATEATFAGAYVVAIETSSEANAVPHRYVAKLDSLTGGNWGRYYAANVSLLDASTALLVTPFQSAGSASFTGIRQGARLVTVSHGTTLPADMWRPVCVGNETYLAAGVLTAFDGRNAFDYGFAHAPAVDLATATVNAGGSQATGTYLYSIVPEYRSAAGVLHRGPPAITYSIDVTGPSGTTTVSIVPVHLSQKSTAPNVSSAQEPLRVLLPVYRSVAGGTELQRLTVEPTYNTLYQTFGAPLSLVDTRSDSNIGTSALTLAERPALYTTGGIFDDEQPPAVLTVFLFANRLWALAGDARSWWYSKAFSDDDGVAPGFSTSFRLVLDEPQTAGAAMDDKAVFFSENGIRYLVGQGPASNGAGNDFVQPIKIQTDVGCDNPRSVVSMPDGIMFQSGRGIQLLTRGLEVVNIGKPILDTLEAYPEITSAVVVAHKNQVRFTCNNTGGTAHTVLVYDYQHKQWTTFRYTHSSTYGGGAIADALMWNGTYTFAMTDGTVYTESSASHLDVGSSWVPVTIKTAWISAAGPLAYHSVRRFSLFGAAVTDHDLTVSVAFDGDAASETHEFVCPNDVTSAGGHEDLQIAIGTRRKCQQVQFTITDATPTTGTVGTGQGMTLSMMGIEVGIKRGLGKKPANKKG